MAGLSFTPDPESFALYDAAIRFSDDKNISVLASNEDNGKRNYILGLTGTSLLIIIFFASWGFLIRLCQTKTGKRFMKKCFIVSRNVHSSQDSSPDGNSSATFTLVRNNEYTICGNLDDKNRFDSLLRRMWYLRVLYLLLAFSLMAFTIILLINITKLDNLIYTTRTTVDKMNSPASILKELQPKMKLYIDEYKILRDKVFSDLHSFEMSKCLNNMVLQNSAGAMEIHMRNLDLDSNQEYMERFVFNLQAGKVLTNSLTDDILSGYNIFFWIIISCVIMVDTNTVFCILFTMKALKRFPQKKRKYSHAFKNTILFLLIISTGLLWCFACGFHVAAVVNGDFCFNGKVTFASSNSTQNIGHRSADDNVLNILRVKHISDDNDLFKIVSNVVNGCPVTSNGNHHSNPDNFMKPMQDKLNVALVANSILYSSIQSSRVQCPLLFSSLSHQLIRLSDVLEKLSLQYSSARNTYDCKDLHGDYIKVTRKKLCNDLPGTFVGNFMSIFLIGLCAMGLITLRFTWETDIEIFLSEIEEIDDEHDEDDNTNNNSVPSAHVNKSIEGVTSREEMDGLDSYSISNSSSGNYSHSLIDNTSSLENNNNDLYPYMQQTASNQYNGAKTHRSAAGTSGWWRS